MKNEIAFHTLVDFNVSINHKRDLYSKIYFLQTLFIRLFTICRSKFYHASRARQYRKIENCMHDQISLNKSSFKD